MHPARMFSRMTKIARRAQRAALIVSLSAILALGSMALSPAKAVAALPEVRTAVPLGVLPDFMLEAPRVAGSSVVLGSYLTTNAGQSWAEHLDLVGSLRYVGNGVQVNLAGIAGVTPCTAEVITLGTFAKATYPVPSCDARAMNDSLVVSWSGSAFSVLNYVQGGTPQTLSLPAGASAFSTIYANLTSAGGLVWIGQGATSWSFAFASSTTSPPSAWTDVPGILGFGPSLRPYDVTAASLLYASGDATSTKLCARVLTNLAATPTCTAGIPGDFTASVPELRAYGSVSLVKFSDVVYAWSGSTVTKVLPAGAKPYHLARGDSAYLTWRDVDGRLFFNKANADGSLGSAVSFPKSPTPPNQVAVTPDRVVGTDSRDGSPYYSTGTAWTRNVTASGFAAETLLPRRASFVSASAGRTALVAREGVSVYDRGVLGYTWSLPSVISSEQKATVSGPYVSVPSDSNDTIIKADGTPVRTFSTIGTLFGSEYVTWARMGTTMRLTIADLTSKAADRVVDLPVGYSACNLTGVWNDLALVGCSVGEPQQVFNMVTGQLVRSLPTTPTGAYDLLWVDALGDGYALVIKRAFGPTGYAIDTYAVWNLASGTLTNLYGASEQGLVTPVTDGVGHVVDSSLTELIWSDYSSLSTSPARVLGWLAPSSFGSGTWTPQIDATKPFAAGVLRISKGSTTVRDLVVPASADGSVRGVSWDGKNTAGTVVASGTYTATLMVSGKDGSGAVKAIDGVALPTTDVAWTGGPVVPPAPGAFAALTPSRLLDTRDGTGVGAAGAVPGNGVIDVQVTGRGGVPATGVGSVILNVTAVTPAGSGYLTVYPSGGALPDASNLNFTPGQVVPNLVVAKVGANGKVSIRNTSPGATHVVADVAGYFADGTVVDPGGLTAVSPSRLLDTRNTGVVPANGTVRVQAAGLGGVPAAGVSAVVVNLTAVTPASSGFLTGYPTGGAIPNASNVNFTAGQVVPNLAFVKLGADGSFTVRNTSPGATQVVVDVAGYVLAGSVTAPGMFVPLSPTRVLDTRPAYGGSGALSANSATVLTMTGAGGVPASGVSGVVLNVTAVASAPGFLTVYPADVGAPNASNLNFTAGQVVPNLVAVKTSTAGQVAIRNSSLGATNVIADVAGYFTA